VVVQPLNGPKFVRIVAAVIRDDRGRKRGAAVF
jgi:hypothetical protein